MHRSPWRRRAATLAVPALVAVLGPGAPALAAAPARAASPGDARATASSAPPTYAPSPGAARATAAASSSAVRQLRWIVAASARLPLPAAEVAAHFSAPTLAPLGGAEAVNAALQAVGPLRRVKTLQRRPHAAQALVRGSRGRLLAQLDTDRAGRIDGLRFRPFLPAPATWSGLEARLRRLAPQGAFAAAEVDAAGRCSVLHGVHTDRAQPLGSAFKLYVLGALAHAVAAHRAAWDGRPRIRDAWKSLPSGTLQDAPAGTGLPLRTYANAMISVSDNTATDHLMHRLGRRAVQAQLRRFGNRHRRRNVPFLTTRELFVLKGTEFPALADRYLALPPARRARALAALDRMPLTSSTPWTSPRRIGRLEWFASPADLCRAYAGLARQAARPGLRPVARALSLEDGGIGLDRARFPTVWFKGGSEPGVLTLTYLARTADGRTLVTAVLLANPKDAIPDATMAELLALARGGLHLADRASRN